MKTGNIVTLQLLKAEKLDEASYLLKLIIHQYEPLIFIDSEVSCRVKLKKIEVSREEMLVLDVLDASGIAERHLQNIFNFQKPASNVILQILANISKGDMVKFPVNLPLFNENISTKLLSVSDLGMGKFLLAMDVFDELKTFEVRFDRQRRPEFFDFNEEFHNILNKYPAVPLDLADVLEALEDGREIVFPVYLLFLTRNQLELDDEVWGVGMLTPF